MKDINNIAFIIHARVNSTRIINKMIRPLGNSNLFELCINNLLKSNIIPKKNIYLAVGDHELIEISKKYLDRGINIFYRTEKSINSSGLQATEIFEWCFELSKIFKYYFIINPCQPFLNIETINKFIETFLKSDNNCLLSSIKIKNFFWNNDKSLNKEQFLDVEPDKFIFNTKYVKETYKASHGLQIGVLSDLVQGKWMGSFKKNDPELYFVEEEESFNIDYPWQFEMAELKYINFIQNKD